MECGIFFLQDPQKLRAFPGVWIIEAPRHPEFAKATFFFKTIKKVTFLYMWGEEKKRSDSNIATDLNTLLILYPKDGLGKITI